MSFDQLLRNDQVVQELSRAIAEGLGGLKYVPGMVVRVVKENMWGLRRVAMTGEVIEFGSFQEFVEAKPPEGLGTTIEWLRKLCCDDVQATNSIDTALKMAEKRGPKNENNFVDNVNEIVRPTGNSQAASLRRLRKDRPDLHQQVLNGKLSANAAAIEAGFRKRKIQVYPEDPENTARLLYKHMERPALEELRKWLDKLLGAEQ